MKIQLKKGLQLNKEVITKLQENQMSKVKGGNAAGTRNSCVCCSCNKQAGK